MWGKLSDYRFVPSLEIYGRAMLSVENDVRFPFP